jgi:putative addiction module killer protein
MFTILESATYKAWFEGLRDVRAKARIDARIRRAALGNLGDWKAFEGIGEMRIDYGPGYRVYFARRGQIVILLLCGGDKRTQAADIKRAKQMLSDLKELE